MSKEKSPVVRKGNIFYFPKEKTRVAFAKMSELHSKKMDARVIRILLACLAAASTVAALGMYMDHRALSEITSIESKAK